MPGGVMSRAVFGIPVSNLPPKLSGSCGTTPALCNNAAVIPNAA